ncbi:TPA: hypothetical protein ACLAX2_001652, partial [Neisseria meningitidis]
MPSEAGFAPNTALMREIPIKGCKNAVRTETWFRRHFKRGCTRLADMLPSKYEDNALQIKEKSTERTAPFFCT